MDDKKSEEVEENIEYVDDFSEISEDYLPV